MDANTDLNIDQVNNSVNNSDSAAQASSSAAAAAAAASVATATAAGLAPVATPVLPRVRVRVQTLGHFKGELPRYQSQLASGFDVRAQLPSVLLVPPGQRVVVPTGLVFEIPLGFEIQARPRSGWALKNGMTVLNTPGTIDADYRGEVKIILINLGQETIEIRDQDRVAQLVLCPVWQADLEACDALSETERGAGGFGSTGRRGGSASGGGWN